MQISFRSTQNAHEVVELQEIVELPRVAEENRQVLAVDPIHAHVHAEASEHLCRVRGQLRTTVEYECSRCLEPTRRALGTEFEEAFTDDPTKADDDMHYVSGDDIELDPFIEEAINLALEFFPVCAEDCKGLCPVCGCNLNNHTCQCETKAIDPRLAALQDLLSEDDSK